MLKSRAWSFSSRAIALGLYFFWALSLSLAFSIWGGEIDQLGARIRALVLTGKQDIRTFRSDGIPLSHIPSTGETIVSPFYVVHYGLAYSRQYENLGSDDAAWRKDDSLVYWDIPAGSPTLEKFKACADWVVLATTTEKGQAHILYNFDWAYPKYPGGMLRAPWWSGLTDGYAILLLLRASDVFHDPRYLETADKLYRSTTAPFSEGGSIVDFNGSPWVEEYVDPRVRPEQMSHVFNGMVYATKGIEAYEARYPSLRPRWSEKLLASARSNAKAFGTGYWSYYDAVGTPANIKYHNINTALLKGLTDAEAPDELRFIARKWETGARWPGYFWVFSDGVSYAKAQFLAIFMTLLIAPVVAVKLWSLRRRVMRVMP